ncbi:hypothetical protein PLESTB_000803000 [Pleodorina starrii]|uniref:XPA C-terminal domain-containing protein n=1 Tax=Pleodorina starrii TaxID=330485 RepID=A0A9W6F348_9CHLO|nr:hypothetical protein PLESTM_000637000 [Pleodorina starrii]GLC53911.1 hypothetical protein PLESTB_000803000 [Pleodorina starrii]GLC75403.1 hypothetical protein PLESTF_001633100 [Pleodorina starrii]
MADGGGFFQASCCESCGNLSFSSEWFQAFGVVLCNHCKRDEALISKGNAMNLYCLTAKDLQGLGCLSKDNPQQKNWSAMKLYLRRQVEERAIKKHGDLETVQQRRHDRTQAKVQGWLAKRARAGAAEEEEEVEGEGDDEEGPDGSGGSAGATRVKLSAAAARVRARLASEYESGATGRGTNKGVAGPSTAKAGAGEEPAGGLEEEVF